MVQGHLYAAAPVRETNPIELTLICVDWISQYLRIITQLYVSFAGEVANTDHYTMLTWDMARSDVDENLLFYNKIFLQSRKDVWTLVSVNAVDQVRQRMAW